MLQLVVPSCLCDGNPGWETQPVVWLCLQALSCTSRWRSEPTALSLQRSDLGKAPTDRTTYQCRRKACRKADKPSMTSRMATVSTANAAKMMKMVMRPVQLLLLSPLSITMVQRTSDSSARRKNRKQILGNSCAQKQFGSSPIFPS